MLRTLPLHHLFFHIEFHCNCDIHHRIFTIIRPSISQAICVSAILPPIHPPILQGSVVSSTNHFPHLLTRLTRRGLNGPCIYSLQATSKHPPMSVQSASSSHECGDTSCRHRPKPPCTKFKSSRCRLPQLAKKS
jgi:hypothetical protein